jgi:hypothetical protein
MYKIKNQAIARFFKEVSDDFFVIIGILFGIALFWPAIRAVAEIITQW